MLLIRINISQTTHLLLLILRSELWGRWWCEWWKSLPLLHHLKILEISKNTLWPLMFTPRMFTVMTLYRSPPHGGYVVMLLWRGMVTKITNWMNIHYIYTYVTTYNSTSVKKEVYKKKFAHSLGPREWNWIVLERDVTLKIHFDLDEIYDRLKMEFC